MPITADIDTAIAWLRSNEGDDGESERCARVAAWIEHEELNRMLRSEARKHGVTVARLRHRLTETGALKAS